MCSTASSCRSVHRGFGGATRHAFGEGSGRPALSGVMGLSTHSTESESQPRTGQLVGRFHVLGKPATWPVATFFAAGFFSLMRETILRG